MKNIKKLLWIVGMLIIALILQMCDYAGYETESINNLSDSLIIVKFQTTENGPDTNNIEHKTILIPPKTEKVIYISYRGVNQRAYDEYKDSMLIFHYIRISKIVKNDTINLSNDFRKRMYWEYSESSKWSTSYKLTIKNENL